MIFAVLNIIAFSLVVIGSINWGLVGIFDFNLVSYIFGATRGAGNIIVYVLVLISALWLIFALFYQNWKISFNVQDDRYSVHHNNNSQISR